MTSVSYPPLRKIKKFFRREVIESSALKNFLEHLERLLEKLNTETSEENNKTPLRDFLRGTLYPEDAYDLQIDYHGIDLTIHHHKEKHPVVLFEVKGPGRPDMVTSESLLKKGMFELVLYYIREEFLHKNTEIKHLVITDCQQMFVFEKSEFYDHFGARKEFVRQVLEADHAEDKTAYIYNQLIMPRVAEVEEKLEYTYFDLGKLKGKGEDSKTLQTIYKFLSPIHLLKIAYYNSDHNELKTPFYNELLYVMGVREAMVNNVCKIVRLTPGNRQEFSLLEQTMHELECYEFKNEEDQFDVAIGLVINWINRILFLKLLESQLLSFGGGGAKKLLTLSRIPNYHVLNDLFWHVLAKTEDQRPKKMQALFADVPYLNSSLFEVSDIEKQYFRINCLNDNGEMKIYAQTVLRDENDRRRKGTQKTLDYLFEFLDAYNFSPTITDSTPNQQRRAFIDASVLGLIFEKINGNKDGSFFTPGHITEYICHDAIRKAVLARMNEHYSLQCCNLNELKEQLVFNSLEQVREANAVVNSVTVCDPSVGSGHFLVSALNEFMAIKGKLGLFLYEDNRHEWHRFTSHSVYVEDDELVVRNAFDEDFVYKPKEPESLCVQRMLFEEKRTIIENCLFGVDINFKSAEICRLRLWIELLKNTYYHKDDKNTWQLRTLPNIDINIKVGDSLASRIPVCHGRAPHSSVYYAKDIVKYKEFVAQYKDCHNKENKRKLNTALRNLKADFLQDIVPGLFTQSHKLTDKQRFFNASMEWMIEFPEILNAKGEFMGFDLVLGNPPYIPLGGLEGTPYYRNMMRLNQDHAQVKVYQTLTGQSDTYMLFVERAMQILKPGGLLSFILPNKWLQCSYGIPLRELFLHTHLTDIVDFLDNQVFGDATTCTCIISLKNEESSDPFNYHRIEKLVTTTLRKDIDEHMEHIDKSLLDSGVWTISSARALEDVIRIKKRDDIISFGEAVKGECHRGILTGQTELFNKITPALREQLIAQHPSAEELIRPILCGKDITSFTPVKPEMNMLFIPKGFTLQGMGPMPTANLRKKRPGSGSLHAILRWHPI